MFKKNKEKYYFIKNGLSSLIRWISVIWKIRDWNTEYTYLRIYKHLSHVKDCLRHDGYGANAVKKANKIRIAKYLAKRLYEEDYLDNALRPVEGKYGEAKIRTENNDALPMYNKVIFDDTPEVRKARDKAYKHAEYIMLNRYIDRWWD